MTGIVLVLLGTLITGGALVAMFLRIRFLTTALTASAAVTRIRESKMEHTENDPTLVSVYYSQLSFTAQDGSVSLFEHQHGTQKPRFREGDRVPVRYNPAAPSKTAELPSLLSELGHWFLMVVPALMGLAFLIAGLKVLRG